MPVESATYISDLNASNPVGATDPKSQGDDHLRLIKSAVKASFPGVSGAVSATHAELNFLDGTTGVTGSGNIALSASPTFTGTMAAANITFSGALTGSGAALTALNASELGSGTVPDARFPATLPAVSGANLTNLNATSLASGTVADGRLSSNVPLKNASNEFTTHQILANASELRGKNTGGTVRHLISIFSDDRIYVGSDAQATQIDGSSLTLSAGDIVASGAITTPNQSASELGYKGIPAQDLSGAYTTELADAGKWIRATGAGTKTIASNASVAYPLGTALTFINSHSAAISIAINSDTMTLAGTTSTGTRSLAPNGMATAVKITSTSWLISGAGLT